MFFIVTWILVEVVRGFVRRSEVVVGGGLKRRSKAPLRSGLVTTKFRTFGIEHGVVDHVSFGRRKRRVAGIVKTRHISAWSRLFG